MKRIRISQISVGDIFEHAVFSDTGQKLLPPQTPVTPRVIEAITRCGALEVFAAEDVDELVREGVVDRVKQHTLRVGSASSQRVVTSTGDVLLESGETVEARHLDALKADGLTAYVASSSNGHTQRRLRAADGLAEALVRHSRTLPRRVKGSRGRPDWLDPQDPNGWPGPEELAARRKLTVSEIRNTYQALAAGEAVTTEAFFGVVGTLMGDASAYPDRFTQLALLCPPINDYLPDHAYAVAVLSMAIGTQLGWGKRDVLIVGLSALVFDMGMLLVPESIRMSEHGLSRDERQTVRRHPLFSVAMLDDVAGIDPVVQLAALQHHERENGTGYPYATRGEHICDYARVLAVADAFGATYEPRNYRHRKLPYVAMEETVHAASHRKLWTPAVRALIRAAGLFPVGSYVKLSDGTIAHVLASHPRHLDRPTVQPIDGAGQAVGQAIDLMSDGGLEIVCPIAADFSAAA